MSGQAVNRPALLVDAGNSCVKWALLHAKTLGPPSVMVQEQDLVSDLKRVWGRLPIPGEVRVSNVAGECIQGAMTETCCTLWGIAPRFAHTSAWACGVTNAYSVPSRLGVDRWLALVAAFQLHGASVMVVDAGTAITLDVADSEGYHLGGLILPGLRLMTKTLLSNTRIANAEQAEEETLLGTDTASCIRSGVIQAATGMIERVRRRLREERDLDPGLFLTGGDATILASGLPEGGRLDPSLVLRGLAMLQD